MKNYKIVSPSTTFLIQVNNKHIEIQYKRAIYILMQNIVNERLDATRKAENGNITVTIDLLKPKEKRVVITKIIVNINILEIGYLPQLKESKK